jgi:hypothetical protein
MPETGKVPFGFLFQMLQHSLILLCKFLSFCLPEHMEPYSKQ